MNNEYRRLSEQPTTPSTETMSAESFLRPLAAVVIQRPAYHTINERLAAAYGRPEHTDRNETQIMPPSLTTREIAGRHRPNQSGHYDAPVGRVSVGAALQRQEAGYPTAGGGSGGGRDGGDKPPTGGGRDWFGNSPEDPDEPDENLTDYTNQPTVSMELPTSRPTRVAQLIDTLTAEHESQEAHDPEAGRHRQGTIGSHPHVTVDSTHLEEPFLVSDDSVPDELTVSQAEMDAVQLPPREARQGDPIWGRVLGIAFERTNTHNGQQIMELAEQYYRYARAAYNKLAAAEAPPVSVGGEGFRQATPREYEKAADAAARMQQWQAGGMAADIDIASGAVQAEQEPISVELTLQPITPQPAEAPVAPETIDHPEGADLDEHLLLRVLGGLRSLDMHDRDPEARQQGSTIDTSGTPQEVMQRYGLTPADVMAAGGDLMLAALNKTAGHHPYND
jgi:hypothetical protein